MAAHPPPIEDFQTICIPLQCKILSANHTPKGPVPLSFSVQVFNSSNDDIYLAPARHVTSLYYDDGEGHTLRLGVRCKVSRQLTTGALLVGGQKSVDFEVEATPFADMPEGNYTITLVFSPSYTCHRGSSVPPFAISSHPFHLQWRHGTHAPPPAVARCVAEEQANAYWSPRTSRPRARRSRPSMSNVLMPAERAAGSLELMQEELDDSANADISPLARFATGRRYSVA